ncbi:MAG: prepilin-type N-terminal cleavage/methylation domain-containing protein [Nitrospirae bacterium]|nr:prepilin-type N-terminal cleavage/methylation domain-containing protein [Nitrospirota bacterium]
MLNLRFKVQNSKLKKYYPICDCNRGLTLLELLISIVILVIIILIIAGAMRLGFRSVDAGEKKTESLERFRTSLNIINSQIQSLLPITYSEEGTQESNFTGSRQSMHFTTNYSLWGIQKGSVEVSYDISSEENGKQVLSASENIMVTEGSTTEESKVVKLLDAFDEIYFDYFYKDPTKEEGEWVEEWTDTLNLPEKIRLHLVNGKRDFAFIIPIRVRVSIAHAKTELSEGEE